MDTKLKGDIAEQAVILKGLRLELGVLRPIGDRLPYDLVIDNKNTLIKVQVKSAWYNKKVKAWIVNTKRSQTNRKVYKLTPYKEKDFNFAIIYLPSLDIFYVIPSSIFVSYKSSLTIVEGRESKKDYKIAKYKEAWNEIINFN